jgi:hypothetical protein
MQETMTRLSRALATLALLAPAVPAQASFDIAQVYLRKVRQGERIYFAGDGWRTRRVRLDLSYETDVVGDAGTADPRLVDPTLNGPPLTAWTTSALLLLTPRDSPYQLTAFTLHTSNFVASDETVGEMPIGFILFPSSAKDDGGGRGLYTGLTGAQLRLSSWLEVAYGQIVDRSPAGVYQYKTFLETNLPFVGPRFSQVVSGAGAIERVQLAERCPDALCGSWASLVEVGHIRQDLRVKRRFNYLEIDQLWSFVSGEVRLTDKHDLAYGRLGVHWSSGAREIHGAKFGTGVDLKLFGTLVNPLRASQWAPETASNPADPVMQKLGETRYGWSAEATVQAPALTILGFLYMLLAVQADAMTGQDHSKDTADVMGKMIDASSENDTVYMALTLAVSRNDPLLLREVPGAIDKTRVAFFIRLIY